MMNNDRIQVLVAAMHQKDDSLLSKMRVSTDAVIGNQCDDCSDHTYSYRGHTARYLNRPERGVGKNRNEALMHADGDILTFADEDMVFEDGYAATISEAFAKLPDADGIIFNIRTVGTDVGRRTNPKIQRVRFYNSLNYGAARLSVRATAVRRENITFHTCFGGGTRYNAGEDTLFIVDMLKHGLRIYVYPETIAGVDQTSSTWFRGYDRKYFHDKGALYAAVSKRWGRLLCLQDLARHRTMYRDSGLPFWEQYRLTRQGMESFHQLKPFE